MDFIELDINRSILFVELHPQLIRSVDGEGYYDPSVGPYIVAINGKDGALAVRKELVPVTN